MEPAPINRRQTSGTKARHCDSKESSCGGLGADRDTNNHAGRNVAIPIRPSSFSVAETGKSLSAPRQTAGTDVTSVKEPSAWVDGLPPARPLKQRLGVRKACSHWAKSQGC